MALPNECSIYCSKCSAYNIGEDCCICKSCMRDKISRLKDKIVENDIYTADEIFRLINEEFAEALEDES